MTFLKTPKIKISPSIFILLGISYFNSVLPLVFTFLGVVLLHEMGHMIMIFLTKSKFKSITISAVGGLIEGYTENSNLIQELLVDFGRPHKQCSYYLNLLSI